MFSVDLPSLKNTCTALAIERSRVFGGRIFVMVGVQIAEEQPDGGHILQTMIAVGRIMERAGFGDYPNRGLMSGDDDFVDFVQPTTNLWVQFNGSFDSGLSMKLGWKRNLE